MIKLPDNKRHILFICAGIFCFLTALVLLQSFKGRFGQDQAVSGLPEMEDTIEVSAPAVGGIGGAKHLVSSAGENNAGSKWVVYVTGSVKKPGVYELSADSRVYNALEAAGGFSADADPDGINLAASVSDGMHIKFPSKNDKKENPANDNQNPQSARPASFPRGGHVSAVQINLNSCTASELENLPGIGPKTAEQILSYREKNGVFARTEDLLLIKGIGPKKYEAIRELVAVAP